MKNSRIIKGRANGVSDRWRFRSETYMTTRKSRKTLPIRQTLHPMHPSLVSAANQLSCGTDFQRTSSPRTLQSPRERWMPTGKDFNTGNRGALTGKKNANCSFCRKSYREVGPLVEGPGDVYICGEVHRAVPVDSRPRKSGGRGGPQRAVHESSHAAREIVEQLSTLRTVVGQRITKKILAVAVHNPASTSG